MNLNQEIISLENSVLQYERDIIIKYNITIPENFKELFNNYKLSIKMLFNDPKFYINIREICTNNNLEIEIWNNEHYEYINNFIGFNNILLNLIHESYKYDLISLIQYKLLKIIFKKIKNIWYSDVILSEMYPIINKKNNNKIISLNELNYFIDMIDIIYYKLHLIKNTVYEQEINENDILNDKKYLSYINNVKNFLESKFL